jgi:hypothetical protein
MLREIQSYRVSAVIVLLTMVGGCSESATSQTGGPQGDSSAGQVAVAPAPMPPLAPTASMNTPFIMPLITAPKTFVTDDVQIPDDMKIIGVVEQDTATAYLCAAMSSMGSHVVNDVVGTRPIAVTFCDRTDCARVLRDTGDGKPTEVQVGGFFNQQMSVYLGGIMYPQLSKEIPLADQPFTQTSWREWKTQHPATRVYLGNMAKECLKSPVESVK